MECSLGIANILEEISGLSHSALITEEGFFSSPCYSWNSAFKRVYLSFSPLPFTSLHRYFVSPPQITILPFCISFFLGDGFDHCLLYEPLSMVLQALCLSDLIP
ncbi:unnamed protein product [Rangifer tarandus platyrhynchus]|uniref:Uncharacterized protein n=2 Tax=Rangifer tarandus platyrhynchus TaxID=3082113 RepID=A0AC59ZCI7_RANTA|nr:unnamed protein product [Rangifer tarandus platyrhynchus]